MFGLDGRKIAVQPEHHPPAPPFGLTIDISGRDLTISSGKKTTFAVMTRIIFICHGNICRSPMAEAIMVHLAAEAGRSEEFVVSSAAVSDEEWSNPIYPPAAAILRSKGIPFDR